MFIFVKITIKLLYSRLLIFFFLKKIIMTVVRLINGLLCLTTVLKFLSIIDMQRVFCT